MRFHGQEMRAGPALGRVGRQGERALATCCAGAGFADPHNEVRDILTGPTFARRLRLEAIANPEVFTYLLDHPDNSALGRALQITPTRLWRVGPGRYQGLDRSV
jgi:hypothetical protein